MPNRTAFLAGALAAGILLGACSSSSHTAAGSPAGSTPAGSTPSGSSSAGSSSAGSSSASPAPASSSTTLFVSGAVPAVTGASDLAKEPVIAPGSGNPPTVLTGKDLVVGTGPVAGPNATAKVQYVGALFQSGKVFDASWTDSGPTSFPLSEVVPGFRDAIIGMHVGGRREIVIPPALGYGAAGSPPVIPPNSTLVFVVDLLGVS